MKTIKNILFCLLAGTVALCATTACEKSESSIDVEDIALDTMSIRLEVGEEYQLNAAVMPEDATVKDVVWTTSDPLIATVSETGVVKALMVGEARISVTTVEGGLRTNCIVNVDAKYIPATEVRLYYVGEDGLSDTLWIEDQISVPVEGRYSLKAKLYPENYSDKYVIWTVQNLPGTEGTIVNLSPTGVVQGMKEGTTTIFATARNRNLNDPYNSAPAVRSNLITVNVTPPMNLTFDQPDVTLNTSDLNNTATLTAILPEGVVSQDLTWESNDESVVIVTPGAGLTADLKALSVGMTTITATSADPAYTGGTSTATCNVIVENGIITLVQGDDAKAAVQNNPGKTILLPSGFEGAFSGVAIPNGGVIVTADPSAAVMPKLTAADIRLNNSIGKGIVRFENVAIVGTGFDQGGYLINEAGSNNVDLAELSFLNCDISEYGRSLIRFQGATQRIDLVQFDGCYLHRCSGQGGQNYAVIQSTVAALGFPEIRVTNSTISQVHVGLMNIGGGSGQPSGDKVVIENCTFYNVSGTNAEPPANRNFIDGGANGPVQITINNSIFGSHRAAGPLLRVATGSTVDGSNNYSTADWTVTDLIPGLTTYAGGCNDLWVAPATGDFHFKDSGFAGKSTAGDPKWR